MLGIVALLLGVTVAMISGVKQRASAARVRADMSLIAQALEEFRRIHGDYPRTGDLPQGDPDPARQPLARHHAQAVLFNALTGVFGATGFAASDRCNGRSCLDASRFSLEIPAGRTSALSPNFQIAVPASPGSPPVKCEELTCLLDPWGGRYVYYHRGASVGAPWSSGAYVLYSAGPDRRHAAPTLDGALTAYDFAAADNVDNIYQDR
ncbi:MAG: hypothetical protein PHQ04_08800 [Opitutaceae bacterium]|nr:hypothetical protein [Opitutaceae bacterium]